jgi:phosphoribosylformimino-5-aminoimidazole carboxamide ribotide isomerase
MLIVPVIDIKGGLVVHARHGDRGRYEPIVTPLSRSAEPEAVLEGLLSAARFEAVYIADLDAITARQPSDPVIERLADRHPMLAFWVDAGISSAAAAAALLAHERFHPVIRGCCCRSTSAAMISLAPRVFSTGRSDGRAG